MKKKILTTVSTLVLVATLFLSVTALAGYQANQQASTSKVTTISIVNKVADNAVATITFPEAPPNATVSNPYNNVDTASDPQFLSVTASEPVVRLKNTSAANLKVWLEITTWTNSIAASEDYELVDTSTTNVNVVNDVLSSDGNAASVDTGVAINSGAYKALYLELVLSSVAGKTGTSMLSVLGETP